MRNSTPRVVIEDNDETPLEVEILQKHIVKISDSFAKALRGGLKLETIVLLVHDKTKISRTDIRAILTALPKLRETYTK